MTTTGRCFQNPINKYTIKKVLQTNTKRTAKTMIPEIENEFHPKINENYTVFDYFGHRDRFDSWVNKFKFYFSFENSYCDDYITEKFWRRGINIGVVPIVAGLSRKDYQKTTKMPEHSFVHLEDFADKMQAFNSAPLQNKTRAFVELLHF